MSLTPKLKKELWRRFGNPDFTAEWDGIVYGGGKISQRSWEYFKTIELLNLEPGARILDIGGGSPATGLSFFPRLLASVELEVAVMDTNFGDRQNIPPNVRLIEALAERTSLSDVIRDYKPTHVSCVSVLEHASEDQQAGIFQAIDDAFTGSCFVCTLEFHETKNFFEAQLTTATLSNAVSNLSRYYLNELSSAPLFCVNALADETRRWYPLALQFLEV